MRPPSSGLPDRTRARVLCSTSHRLAEIYAKLHGHFGDQHWWPADTALEVCVGAILVQNTAWTGVEKSIARLKQRELLHASLLYHIPESELADLIRPSGTYRIKARRLRAFLRVLVEGFASDLGELLGGPLSAARARLLAIPGIGPETADAMLLYAGGQEVFVVDAYTRRVCSRHGWVSDNASYEELQRWCGDAVPPPAGSSLVAYWRDFHAQFVAVGKLYCRARTPLCEICPLQDLLPTGQHS